MLHSLGQCSLAGEGGDAALCGDGISCAFTCSRVHVRVHIRDKSCQVAQSSVTVIIIVYVLVFELASMIIICVRWAVTAA